MMTSSQIRQSFMDFFKSKEHTIVPSSSLMPDSPNLLFTNAGMNQFVPIFLGQTKCPYTPPRAADTQKCIRAGGKHNDLDDVGLDTYHHTFFEMLGNWSFGNYFKKEAIEWAWQLVIDVWRFPPNRIYATVYSPDKSLGDPSEFDQQAYDCWAEKFLSAGLDPKTHIVNGNKKDNFWMMGETGPCGPCSELHVDLTPDGDTKGSLVNKGDARCIEIWNLVFIQFNANPDGTFSPLPAKHVDTGMGFERVTSIIQGTKNFSDFANAKISNYETDIFRPIFDKLEKMSGKKYRSTLPGDSMGSTGNLPVPLGDSPSGTGEASNDPQNVSFQTDVAPHSGGQVARRDGLVARSTQDGSTQTAPGATYSKRNLPHFEKPWAIYHVIINTVAPRKLSPAVRDVVFDCILHWRDRYRLVAACVMPDHAHFIIQPGVKEDDKEGNPVFWPLSEILHSIKSYSAKEVNKLDNVKGTLWQEERYDRYMRSDLDLQEKFQYLCRNPWSAGLVQENEPWPWLWTPEIEASKPYVGLSERKGDSGKGSTGDSPVPVGDPPTGMGGTSPVQSPSHSATGAPSHSAGLVAQRHGLVARSTQGNATPEQIQLDIAFRVIADHIRTLSFAIADGIQPGNTDRNYVLRRILRRAVRYGRTLGFHEPFFYKLVDVLADTMGDVFPEIRARRNHVEEVIQREEEAFNKTLDRGIGLFEEEVAKLMGTARVPRAVSGVAPETRSSNISTTIETVPGAKYSKRHLPHFERPWGKYMVTFSTQDHRQLSPKARDIVLNSLLFTDRQRRWQLFAACVMPDHVHALFEPQIKEQDPDGNPIFWSLTELLHSVKSFTAHEINNAEGNSGAVWEKESFDRLMRSDEDLEEKFHYICRNPWENNIVPVTENYSWLWTPGVEQNEGVPPSISGVMPEISSKLISSEKLVERSARRDASQNTRDACDPQISGAFAFRLYDEQGFPLDLTELMARERGLSVDKEGFEKLMEEQRARARAAQKKEVISLSEIQSTTPTKFVGFDNLTVDAKVLEVVKMKDKNAVILDTSTAYAEMGGQLGDTGELSHGGQMWRVVATQKTGNTWLHFIEEGVEQATSLSRSATRRTEGQNAPIETTAAASQSDVSPIPVGGSPTGTGESPVLPIAGAMVTLSVDRERRNAIQRHHTVTHLLHWALHEVVSGEASQKGSLVAPEKLTFDFNSAPLTPEQLSDIEKLVNERILENAGVSWTEVSHADVKSRKDVMQFFGDKYGDTVRVVQIGGRAGELDGYSMELCGGTHTRATGEIGLFRIIGESAIAAGVRRIEAVAGLEAYNRANQELQLIKSVAGKINSPIGELEKKIEALLAQQKELEKQIKATQQQRAAGYAAEVMKQVQQIQGVPTIVANCTSAGFGAGDEIQEIVNALKSRFNGLVVLGGASGEAVSLVASVSPDFTSKIQAGKIIQLIAPIVGGKGGGKPDNARGGGKDASKLDEALAKAKSLLE